MTIKDNALLNIATGRFYLADVGTTRPVVSSLLTPGASWTEIGHTSVDNVFGIESEGGDVTTLATLQSKAVRTTRTPVIETFRITLMQFDVASLQLYFGSNAVSSAGWLDVPDTIVPTTKAFLAVFVDGDEEFGIYAAKAEIQRADAPEFNDSSALSGLPISVRPLSYNGSTSPYSLTPLAASGS